MKLVVEIFPYSMRGPLPRSRKLITRRLMKPLGKTESK